MEIPKEWFPEPTEGGCVTGAELKISESDATVSYVDVHGIIRPVDPESFNIEWEVLLPLAWNGRTVQLGGGANCGQIPRLSGSPVLGNEIPIDLGYVVYGDDSGHQSEDAMSAEFAANQEALNNYIRLHLIKAHFAMRYVVQKFYGKEPELNYFAGGSAGGREALECAAAYGDYYDGIFCASPCSNFVLVRMWGAILSQAVYESYDAEEYPYSDGFIDEDIVKAIQEDAIEWYDELDGLKDGIVSNIYAARANRDNFLKMIREKYELTDAQIKTLDVYENGFTLDYAMANGMNSYHGYSALEGGLMDLGPDPVPREPLDTRYNVHHGDRADGMFKYFITGDPSWKLIDHDYFHPDPKLYENLLNASRRYDVNAPEFDRFLAHGGKMILFAAWNDMSLGPWQIIQQYRGYVEKYGQETVDSFCKFFIMPDVVHCYGAQMGYLKWLDSWCSTGKWPEDNVSATMLKTGGQMPMAEFPGWVKYVGGDPMKADSYEVSYEIPEGFWGRFD